MYFLTESHLLSRIADVDMAVSWVLKPQHRSRVMFQRFMPWWNAQRRKEIAEKKEAEQRKIEEEKRQEAEKILKEQEENEAMLLEEHIQKKPDETEQQNENDDFSGNVEEITRQGELLEEQKDSEFQQKERNTIERLAGKDVQNNSVPEKLEPIEKEIKESESIVKDNRQTEVKNVTIDSKRGTRQVSNQVCVKKDATQVGVQITLKQDPQNGKKGIEIHVNNQVAIKVEANKEVEIKPYGDETKNDSNKKKNLNEICIKIDKLNNFENKDIVKAHSENNKAVTVKDLNEIW